MKEMMQIPVYTSGGLAEIKEEDEEIIDEDEFLYNEHKSMLSSCFNQNNNKFIHHNKNFKELNGFSSALDRLDFIMSAAVNSDDDKDEVKMANVNNKEDCVGGEKEPPSVNGIEQEGRRQQVNLDPCNANGIISDRCAGDEDDDRSSGPDDGQEADTSITYHKFEEPLPPSPLLVPSAPAKSTPLKDPPTDPAPTSFQLFYLQQSNSDPDDTKVAQEPNNIEDLISFVAPPAFWASSPTEDEDRLWHRYNGSSSSPSNSSSSTSSDSEATLTNEIDLQGLQNVSSVGTSSPGSASSDSSGDSFDLNDWEPELMEDSGEEGLGKKQDLAHCCIKIEKLVPADAGEGQVGKDNRSDSSSRWQVDLLCECELDKSAAAEAAASAPGTPVVGLRTSSSPELISFEEFELETPDGPQTSFEEVPFGSSLMDQGDTTGALALQIQDSSMDEGHTAAGIPAVLENEWAGDRIDRLVYATATSAGFPRISTGNTTNFSPAVCAAAAASSSLPERNPVQRSSTDSAALEKASPRAFSASPSSDTTESCLLSSSSCGPLPPPASSPSPASPPKHNQLKSSVVESKLIGASSKSTNFNTCSSLYSQFHLDNNYNFTSSQKLQSVIAKFTHLTSPTRISPFEVEINNNIIIEQQEQQGNLVVYHKCPQPTCLLGNNRKEVKKLRKPVKLNIKHFTSKKPSSSPTKKKKRSRDKVHVSSEHSDNTESESEPSAVESIKVEHPPPTHHQHLSDSGIKTPDVGSSGEELAASVSHDPNASERIQNELELEPRSKVSEEEPGDLNVGGACRSSSCSPQEGLDPLAEFQEMHQRHLVATDQMRLRSVLRKPGHSKKRRNVTFNESLNVFYEAECSCWVHEEEYARLRAEEHERREREEREYYQQYGGGGYQTQQQQQHHQGHPGHLHHQQSYELPPVEYEDQPTLSPPEGYKDRFFPQEIPMDPDVTKVRSPPSPPAARRKVFLKEHPIVNGQDEEEAERSNKTNKTSRLGGILKGGRLWRSNSAEGKKVSVSPSDEPDVVKCTDPSSMPAPEAPLKVSTGTAPLRTSEQIRLAVDSTLRQRSKNKKQECSSLVEKLRWLTSLDDDDSDSNASGFATWPSRDKNGVVTKGSTKSDAGTSTSEEFVQSSAVRPSINEAKIKQISYTLEDIDEGLKTGETELESFISEDGERIERIRKRYGEDIGGDDYGFSRRPSVKGIKAKFSSTNQIFAQFTMRGETPIPVIDPQTGQQQIYDPSMLVEGHLIGPVGAASAAGGPQQMALLNYEFANAPGRQSDDTRAHFDLIRQSFEPGGGNYAVAVHPANFNRPHSWSVSTLPQQQQQGPPVSANQVSVPQQQAQMNNLSNPNLPPGVPTPPPPPSGPAVQQLAAASASSSPAMLPPSPNPNGMGPQQQQQMMYYATLPHGNPGALYGTLPHPSQQQQQMYMQQNNLNGVPTAQQQMYGTVRRVPNVIGRPLFLHYGALSTETHPNKIPVYPNQQQVPETPSPTQQPPPMRYYGPPIRYYNPPPPVPPRTAASAPSNSVAAAAAAAAATATVAAPNNVVNNIANNKINNSASLINVTDHERGVPEGATDEEPTSKEPYSMNV